MQSDVGDTSHFRLFFKNVKCRSTQLLALQPLQQRGLINDGTAGYIYKKTVGAKGCKHRIVDNVKGGGTTRTDDDCNKSEEKRGDMRMLIWESGYEGLRR
jgi:hypothetical protein